QDLADIHAAWHTERIEHDIDLLAIGEKRHVFHRHDLGHDALVAVATRHLVARLDLALHGDKDLHHLHHARRQFITALQFLDLVKEALLQAFFRFVILFANGLDLGHQLVVWGRKQPPLRARIFLEYGAGDLRFLLEALWTRDALAALKQLSQPAIHVAVKDRLLVVAVLGQSLDFLAFDGKRALILVDAVAIENADLDHSALNPRR